MTIENEEQFMEDPPEEEEEEEDEEDEEDLIDPRDAILEKCGESHHCAALKEELDVCTDRVNGRSKTEETCTQELFDFLHCVDHCAASKTLSLYK